MVPQLSSDIEYLFEHGEVINYSLDGVSIHPVTTKIQISFLTQLPERKETAQGFIKTVTEFNDCDRRKLRMDQQHSSFKDSIMDTLTDSCGCFA